MFYQIFLSPQVKWCLIITYKHGIYELPHKLPRYFTQKLESILDISLATAGETPQPTWPEPLPQK